MLETPILQVEELSIGIKNQPTKTLIKPVNLTLHESEIVGLVGESGSGKSLLAKAIAGLLPHEVEILGGTVKFKGIDMGKLRAKERRALLGSEISFIFQNYQESLTPHIGIGKQMMETLQWHRDLSRKEAAETVLHVLEKVNLPASRVFHSYPFQLSGGQLQRVAISFSLLLRPTLILADEPTTALDTITRKSILELLAQVQKETKACILFISHDLGQVQKITDRMVVMYKGEVVETAATQSIEAKANHPYTRLLLNSRLTLQQEVCP
jgi:ABC-type dipeptide/oligopeptide/nickel transport system ATPase component